MATRAELIRRTLDKLVVVGVGEVASADDIATVSGYVDDALTYLSARGVYFGGGIDDLADAGMNHLAEICRNFAAAAYSQAYSEDAVITAENHLRELSPGDGAGTETIKALYY